VGEALATLKKHAVYLADLNFHSDFTNFNFNVFFSLPNFAFIAEDLELRNNLINFWDNVDELWL